MVFLAGWLILEPLASNQMEKYIINIVLLFGLFLGMSGIYQRRIKYESNEPIGNRPN